MPLDPKHPETYPRRILVCVAGLTPQVVTETLYYLAVRAERKFVPTEVHVLTTGLGAEQAKLDLLVEENGARTEGAYYKLCREYGLYGSPDDTGSLEQVFNSSHLHVAVGANGKPLADIYDEEANLSMANFVTSFIARLSATPDCDDVALHVSLAGGRKTMGYLAGQALNLLGRPQDRLSHVLVNPPYDAAPKFFFPTKATARVDYYDSASKKNLAADASKAKVTLAEIPFLWLRGMLPPELVAKAASFQSLFDGAQRAFFEDPRLEVDPAHGTVVCGEYEVGGWPKDELAFYALLANEREKQAEEDQGVPRNAGVAESINYLRYYARCVPGAVELLEKGRLHEGLERELHDMCDSIGMTYDPRKRQFMASDGAFEAKAKKRAALFAEWRTRAGDVLAEKLGPYLARRYAPVSEGSRKHTTYCLPRDLVRVKVLQGAREAEK